MIDLIARLRGRLFCLTCKVLRKKVYIGKGLKIYKKLLVKGNGKITIGENCVVDGIVGDSSQYVCLDTHSENAGITIGNNAKLYAARITAKYSITIGNDFHIEESGIADTDFHSIDATRGDPHDEKAERCKIDIGDRVFIGAKSYIGKGTKIGDEAIVWPCSTVTASVKSGVSVCGNPARPIKC